ncbi:MAG: T9SS type A sorting domain-containing protein [Candidatus Kapaibacterium sp.]|jgi:hypothetical protein
MTADGEAVNVLAANRACASCPNPTHTTATPKGRIVSSLTADRDTIDFGYIMAGNDSAFVFKDIYFLNDGDEDLVVRDSGIEITPVAPSDSRSEFSYPAVFPINVPVGSGTANPVTLTVRCQATTFLTVAPEGENLVRMRIRLAFGAGAKGDSTVAERTFVLRFTKTVRPLWASPAIRFDTVYAGSNEYSSQFIVLRNTDLKRTLIVDDTVWTSLRGSAGRFEFEQTPLLSFARDSAKPRTISVRYTAAAAGSPGTDSVNVGLVHYNPSVLRTATDTTNAKLVGVSVEQRMEIAGVRGRRATRIGDTVDAGSWTIGARDTVTIVIRNSGNIPFNSQTQIVTVGTHTDAPFILLDSINKSGRHIASMSTDSMRLIFAPTDVGEKLMKVILRSDIATRVKGVPQSAQEIVFYVRGIGRQRYVTSAVSALEFDSIAINPECPDSRVINLRVRNSSSSPGVLSSLRALPSAGYVVPSGPITIGPESEVFVPITFAPLAEGQYAAVLIVQAGIDDGPMLLQLYGTAVQPATMDLRLPQEQRVFPGHEIVVPLWGRGDIMSRASRCTASVDYDSSVLKYLGFDNIDCAAASGSIKTSGVSGSLKFEITMPSAFFKRDTLLRLRFRSSLGNRDRTALSVQSIDFGTELCARVFAVNVPTGVVLLDSLCGISHKLPTGPVAVFSIDVPRPSPVEHSAQVRYTVATPGTVDVAVYNLMGERVLTLASAYHESGSYQSTLPAFELENGVYILRLHSGEFCEDIQLVVSH